VVAHPRNMTYEWSALHAWHGGTRLRACRRSLLCVSMRRGALTRTKRTQPSIERVALRVGVTGPASNAGVPQTHNRRARYLPNLGTFQSGCAGIQALLLSWLARRNLMTPYFAKTGSCEVITLTVMINSIP
jgi:hypothetical protein